MGVLGGIGGGSGLEYPSLLLLVSLLRLGEGMMEPSDMRGLSPRIEVSPDRLGMLAAPV